MLAQAGIQQAPHREGASGSSAFADDDKQRRHAEKVEVTDGRGED
jgi:hypothetical protein